MQSWYAFRHEPYATLTKEGLVTDSNDRDKWHGIRSSPLTFCEGK